MTRELLIQNKGSGATPQNHECVQSDKTSSSGPKKHTGGDSSNLYQLVSLTGTERMGVRCNLRRLDPRTHTYGVVFDVLAFPVHCCGQCMFRVVC